MVLTLVEGFNLGNPIVTLLQQMPLNISKFETQCPLFDNNGKPLDPRRVLFLNIHTRINISSSKFQTEMLRKSLYIYINVEDKSFIIF